MDIFYQYSVGEKLLLFDRLKLFYLFHFYFVPSTDEISKFSDQLIKREAQRATIAHLSPMCQGQMFWFSNLFETDETERP